MTAGGPVEWAREQLPKNTSLITWGRGGRGHAPLEDVRAELLAEIATAERHITEWTERHDELEAEAMRAEKLRNDARLRLFDAHEKLLQLHRRLVLLFPVPPGVAKAIDVAQPKKVQE